MAYQRDGAPNGYFVIDFQDNAFAPRYKAANLPARQQMHVAMLNRWDLQLPANTVTSGEVGHTQLAVNVWAGSALTEVTCRFDGDAETTGIRNPVVRDPYAVTRQEALDAWMLDHRSWQNLFPPPIRAKIGAENWMQTSTSMHLWTCPLPAELTPGAHRATGLLGASPITRRSGGRSSKPRSPSDDPSRGSFGAKPGEDAPLCRRLRPSTRGQAAVEIALHAAGEIPLGLAVAQDQQVGEIGHCTAL